MGNYDEILNHTDLVLLDIKQIAEEGDSLLLANGRVRRAESPKRKRRKHVSRQGACDARTRTKLLENGRLTNSEIRKALALWTGDEDAN